MKEISDSKKKFDIIDKIKSTAEQYQEFINEYLTYNNIENKQKVESKVLKILEKPNSNRKFDKHKIIEAFQKQVCEELNRIYDDQGWQIEYINDKRPEGDKVDIIRLSDGENQPTIIIEIDASRGDQVAKKLLSRIELFADNKTAILYVALLYPDTQNGEAESEKFVKYGNGILKKINSNSSAFGIYMHMRKNKCKMVIWGFDNEKYIIKDKENKKLGGCFSMIDCAKEAVRQIMKDNMNLEDAEKIFNHNGFTFIKGNEGKSRHSQLDNTDIYVYSQWRLHGNNWRTFKKICEKNGICIIDETDNHIKQR